MSEENPLVGKRVIVTQTDNFVKYGEYYKHEHFGIWLKSDKYAISYIKGKVAKIFQDDSTKNLILEAEDSLTGDLVQNAVEMVILATGMKPATSGLTIDKTSFDNDGFLKKNGTPFLLFFPIKK